MAQEPCPESCPSGPLVGCEEDVEYIKCLAEEILVLSGIDVEYWHWDEPNTDISPEYAEPSLDTTRGPGRWEWDTPHYNMKAMVTAPFASQPEARVEGFGYQENLTIEVLRANFVPGGGTLPMPDEGDIIGVGDRYYDVVKVGKGQYFAAAVPVTHTIDLQYNEEYVPDRRIVP